jgi:DNA recombination protein RmuC
LEQTILLIAGVLAGIAVGFFLGRFVAIRQNSAADAGAGVEAELRRQISQKEEQLRTAQGLEKNLIGEKAAAVEGLAAERKLLEERRQDYERRLQEQREAQEKALADLREAFRALSADALEKNAPQFLQMAEASFQKLQETAKGDLAQRQESIAGLLKPLEEQLKTYQQRLAQSETAQSSTMGEVKKQLETLTNRSESLAQETEKFRTVLKSNQARGRWGEETLRRVVEAAGMSAHCDFSEQTHGEDGRPDLIVRLPGNRIIIVDSKVPDLDFIAALETADPEKRGLSLEAHAAKLKETIKSLAARKYPAQFENALDHVVLFLPAESLFSAALEGDNELIVWAARQKIMLATPASLIGLLRAVSVSWDQQKQSENTRAISEAAQELYKRVATFSEHFARIRDGLAKAHDAFNDASGSWERMVRPQGEKLVKLGAVASKEIAELNPLETSLRLPANPGG